jgi:hypothetical protein
MGLLGNSSRTGNGPVQVTGLTSATQVSAGDDFSLALYVPPTVATP